MVTLLLPIVILLTDETLVSSNLRLNKPYVLNRMIYHQVFLYNLGSPVVQAAGSIHRSKIIGSASSDFASLVKDHQPPVIFLPLVMHFNLMNFFYEMVFHDIQVHPKYKPATGHTISQHDISVLTVRYCPTWWYCMNYTNFRSHAYRTDIVDMDWVTRNPNAMARITYATMINMDGFLSEPTEFTIFPPTFCERFFLNRGYDARTMICGRSTHYSKHLCNHQLGTAIYFFDESDPTVTHLLAISIKQDNNVTCVENEPNVFLLLSSETSFLEKALE